MHFRALDRAVRLPILVYDIPSRTGQELSVETLVTLSTLEHVVGVEDSTGTNGLRSVGGCPVIDPIAAPIVWAEMATRLRRTTEFERSRLAYPLPSRHSMEAIFGKDETTIGD